jgi:hypothetical protein
MVKNITARTGWGYRRYWTEQLVQYKLDRTSKEDGRGSQDKKERTGRPVHDSIERAAAIGQPW